MRVIPHLLMPLRTAPVLLALMNALLLALAHGAGLFGVPVGVILASWFFKYGFALLDGIVAGEPEPPVLSYEMIQPLQGGRLLARAAVIPLGAVLPLVLPSHGFATVFVVYLAAQLGVLEVFAALGGLIFENRVRLGLDTLSPQERRARRDRTDLQRERKAMLDRAYALLRLQRRADAWREIQGWLEAHGRDGNALPELHTLFTAASAWDDQAIADRVASEYLDRLLAARETGLAIDVLAGHLARQPDFRPASPATTVRLVELARLAGRGPLSRRLAANAGLAGPDSRKPTHD